MDLVPERPEEDREDRSRRLGRLAHWWRKGCRRLGKEIATPKLGGRGSPRLSGCRHLRRARELQDEHLLDP